MNVISNVLIEMSKKVDFSIRNERRDATTNKINKQNFCYFSDIKNHRRTKMFREKKMFLSFVFLINY